MNMRDVLAIILAGGSGTRLYPLTKDRAKPAVPFGGIYRLIDFTLSNVTNSNIRKTFILSQYKSDSLQRHIQLGWNLFSPSLGEFISLLPPQQRISEEWYTGTASAVYQNFYSIRKINPKYVLILSADHVYKMDYSKILEYHERVGADLTVGAIDIPVEDAGRFGMLQMNAEGRITGFKEKPKSVSGAYRTGDRLCGSMGVYVFNTEALYAVLEENVGLEAKEDFGNHIIPSMLNTHRVYGYAFVDENKKTARYWRDVGTIDSFWETNMDLVSVDPALNLYDSGWPIRTFQAQYPPAKTVFAGGDNGERLGLVLDSIISNGCIISGGKVQNSVLSPGVRVNSYAEVHESILMDGARIGRHAKVRRTIIGKDVIVPPGTLIGYDLEEDRKRFTVSEKGIAVIPKGTVLPPVPVRTVRYGRKKVARDLVGALG